MSGWQKIEGKPDVTKAPWDGRFPGVLVAWDYEDDPSPDVKRLWCVDAAYWNEGEESSGDYPGHGPTWVSATTGNHIRPTHWMELPEPPEENEHG